MNVYSLIGDAIGGNRIPAVVNRRERHRLLRRADIIRAAEHIFALKGYHRATIQDIAKEAQYAAGTVYLYFADKDALYISIVEDKLKDILLLVKEKAAKARSAKEKLEISIYENLSFFEKNQDFFRIFISEESRWAVTSRFSKSHIAPRYKEYGVELIKQAQAENLIRRDLDPKQMSDMLASIITTVIFDLVQSGSSQKIDLKKMAEVILDMFLNGARKK